MVVVGGDLDREGYLHLRDVIDPSLVTPELIEHISSTPPNPADGYSGILRPQHTPATVEIERQTIEAILKAHPGLDVVTQPRTQDPVQLVPGRPLIAIKVGPNADKKKTGGLNWHVDAYSYFLRGDHHQWYVAYTPILKANERDSNLAVIPYSVLQKVDPRAYEKLKGRGAAEHQDGEAAEGGAEQDADARLRQQVEVDALERVADEEGEAERHEAERARPLLDLLLLLRLEALALALFLALEFAPFRLF